EGHKGEVGGVQHELDAHEHHEHIAADEEPDRADGENQGGKCQIPGGRDAHGADTSESLGSPSPASTGTQESASDSSATSASSGPRPAARGPAPSSSGAATSSGEESSSPIARGRRASTTAPTTATTSRAAVTSN